MKKDMIKKTLKNGVPVYFYKDKNLKKVVVSYNIKYGTNGFYDEFYYKDKKYKVNPGMAHFLEHYLIEHSPNGNMLHRFIGKHYDTHGGTYFDLTTYYFIGIEDIKESLKELIEMVDNPKFTSENIEEVKSAIIDELRKTDDNKYNVAFNTNRRNLYRGYSATPVCGNVLGTKKSTEAISLEDAKICYDAYYNDENKFLVIGGNIDIDEYMDYINEIIDKLPSHKNYLKKMDYDDDFKVRCEYAEVKRDIDTDFVIVSYKIKNTFKEPILLQDLYLFLHYRLKFSSETEFTSKLINDKIIIGGIGMSTDFVFDDIIITFSADVLNKDEFIRQLEANFNTENLDEHLFDLTTRNQIANELSKLDYLYRAILRFPVEIDFSEKLYNIDTIKNCSFENMKKFIDKLDLTNRTVTLLRNKD